MIESNGRLNLALSQKIEELCALPFDDRDSLGNTPIHRLVDFLHYELAVGGKEPPFDTFENARLVGEAMTRMLQAGADPDVVNEHQLTALHRICDTHNKTSHRMVQLMAAAARALVKDGDADINVLDSFNNTPLMRITARDHKGLIEAFLNLGADPNIPNKAGDTPLDYASISRRPDLVELFLKHGADPDAPRTSGTWPIHYAMAEMHRPHEDKNYRVDTVRLLVEATSPDVLQAKNADGFTPKDLAEKAHPIVREELLDILRGRLELSPAA